MFPSHWWNQWLAVNPTLLANPRDKPLKANDLTSTLKGILVIPGQEKIYAIRAGSLKGFNHA
jgi:hypothetical protein